MMAYSEMFVAVVKCQGKILRERDGVVTLPFGSEYSIFLKNKNARKALVTIEIDGNNVLDGKELIISPNSEFELEGFLKGVKTTNKFRFIQKTKQISDYRGDNIDDGIIRIEFRYEKKVISETRIIEERVRNVEHHHHHYYQPWFSGSSFTYGSSVKGTCDSINVNHVRTENNVVMDSLSSPLADEGITVKGSESHQQFNYGYIGELEESSSAIVLKLRGVVNLGDDTVVVKKAIDTRSKIECPTCGNKSKSFAKFCPNCGTALF